MCLSVCVWMCLEYSNFWKPWPREFIFAADTSSGSASHVCMSRSLGQPSRSRSWNNRTFTGGRLWLKGSIVFILPKVGIHSTKRINISVMFAHRQIPEKMQVLVIVSENSKFCSIHISVYLFTEFVALLQLQMMLSWRLWMIYLYMYVRVKWLKVRWWVTMTNGGSLVRSLALLVLFSLASLWPLQYACEYVNTVLSSSVWTFVLPQGNQKEDTL